MSEPAPIVGPYVPKHVLVWGQVIRTVCAVLALAVNCTVLIIVLSR